MMVVARFTIGPHGVVKLRAGDTTFLAEATGRSPDHIGRCLRGERIPAPELQAQLERLIGVPLNKVAPARVKRVVRK